MMHGTIQNAEPVASALPDYKIKENMANTVTLERILGKIKSETYTRLPSGKVLVCELMLENGFSVRGEAAVVDPANYNEEIGIKISRENAVDQIWQLEGYLLQEELYKGTK